MVKSRLSNKYTGPGHLWQTGRLKEEADLKRSYGYKNKKEAWKMFSQLRNFRAQARRLIPKNDVQAELEKKQLIDRLSSLGLIKEGAKIEDVLALKIKDVFERRLQSIVLRKQMANSVKQARQFITHGHIVIGENKVTSPSHLVTTSEEPLISYAGNSALMSEMHPERVAAKREKVVEKTKAEQEAEAKAAAEEEVISEKELKEVE